MKVTDFIESVKILGFLLRSEGEKYKWNSSWMEWTDLIYIWTDWSLCEDEMLQLLIGAWAGGEQWVYISFVWKS